MTIAIILGVAVIAAVVLVLVGMRTPESRDPIQARLAEYSVRDEPVTLEEIELSQRFQERIILPMLNRVGKLASRFTPQATLESTKQKMETAGNSDGAIALLDDALHPGGLVRGRHPDRLPAHRPFLSDGVGAFAAVPRPGLHVPRSVAAEPHLSSAERRLSCHA